MSEKENGPLQGRLGGIAGILQAFCCDTTSQRAKSWTCRVSVELWRKIQLQSLTSKRTTACIGLLQSLNVINSNGKCFNRLQ